MASGPVNNGAEAARRRAEEARKALERARAQEKRAEAARKRAEKKPEQRAELNRAKKNEQKLEERVANRGKDFETRAREANAEAAAAGENNPYSQQRINRTELKATEVRDAIEGASAPRRRELSERLGVEDTTDARAIRRDLTTQREYDDLKADPKTARTLEDLEIRNPSDLRGLGDRLAQEANGESRGLDALDLSGTKDKDALAKVIRGAGTSVGGPAGELISSEKFADDVAGGKPVAKAAKEGGYVGDQQLEEAAERIRVKDPGNGRDSDASRVESAEALRTELKKLDPADRKRLLDKVGDETIKEIARGANGAPDEDVRKSILSDLSEAAKLTGPSGAKRLAKDFAEVAVDENTDVDNEDQLGGAFKSVVEDGSSPLFGAEVAKAMRANGLDEGATDVSQGVTEGMKKLNTDFQGAAADYAQMQQDLNANLQRYGDFMSEGERKDAIEAFENRPENKEITERYNELSARMGDQLRAANTILDDPGASDEAKSIANEAIKNAPAYAASDAGRKDLANTLEASGRGESTWLDKAKSVADTFKPARQGKAFLDGLAQATVNATTSRVLDLQSKGRVGEAQQVLGGLINRSDILGVPKDKLHLASNKLDSILVNSGSRRMSAQDDLKNLLSEEGGAFKGTRAAQVFGGLGVGFSAISAADGIKNWDSLNFQQKVQTSIGTLGVTSDVASMGLSAFSNGAEDLDRAGRLSKAFGTGSKVLGVVGAGVSAFQAVDAFSKGNTTEGAFAAANTVGTVLLAIPSPHTKIAGGIILGASSIGSNLFGKGDLVDGDSAYLERRDQAQANARTFLEAGGVPPSAAGHFANQLSGDENDTSLKKTLETVAPFLGKTPQEVFDYLSANPEKIEDFTTATLGIDGKGIQRFPDRYPGQPEENKTDSGGDKRQYGVLGPDGKIRPGATGQLRDDEGLNVLGQDDYASGLDAAVYLHENGLVPKEWAPQVPEQYRDRYNRAT